MQSKTVATQLALLVLFLAASCGGPGEPFYSRKISECRTDFGNGLNTDCVQQKVLGASMDSLEFVDHTGKKIQLRSINRPKYIQTFSRYVGNAAREMVYLNQIAKKHKDEIVFILLLPENQLEPLPKDLTYPLNYDSVIYDKKGNLRIASNIIKIPYDDGDVTYPERAGSNPLITYEDNHKDPIIHGVRELWAPPTTYYVSKDNRIVAMNSIYDVNISSTERYERLERDSIPGNENISSHELSKYSFYDRVPKLIDALLNSK